MNYKNLSAMTLVMSLFFCYTLSAEETKGSDSAKGPQTLDELLLKVKADQKLDQQVNVEREKNFMAAKDKQAALLSQAKKELAAARKRGDQLKAEFDKNEKKLSDLEAKLALTVGTLGELFGVVRQVAGDTKGQFQNSIVTSEMPERTKFVADLATRKELPAITDLEKLWLQLFTEMTESGKVKSFDSKVTLGDGSEVAAKVTRVGVFNLVSEGQYLNYNSESGKMIALSRQPQGRWLSLIEDFQEAEAGELSALGIDPSRGTILNLLVQAPGLLERINQGGLVGYVILSVLLIGVLLSGERLVFLLRLSQKVKEQMRNKVPDPSNPLGLIYKSFEENKHLNTESLELKVEEAVMKGTASLERGLGTIKILSGVAPLLGLLGTVTGMIVTFQSITLFGAGDPKLMAGGISQALVTTVLGLVAAIPLILLHSVVSGRSKVITEILEEQSIGLMALRVEQEEN